MYNFKKTAEKMTVLSELMTGREQIKTKDIIKKYADGVTITDFDFAVLDDKAFVVLTFAEEVQTAERVTTALCLYRLFFSQIYRKRLTKRKDSSKINL